MTWSMTHIEKLLANGAIVGYRASASKSQEKGVTGKRIGKSSNLKHMQLEHIESVLKEMGIEYVKEFRFDKKRRFRFDIAIPDKRIACEYEGIYSKKSRHTTKSGYSKDAEKYTLAAVLGWRVMRYTASTYKNFRDDLKGIMK